MESMHALLVCGCPPPPKQGTIQSPGYEGLGLLVPTFSHVPRGVAYCLFSRLHFMCTHTSTLTLLQVVCGACAHPRTCHLPRGVGACHSHVPHATCALHRERLQVNSAVAFEFQTFEMYWWCEWAVITATLRMLPGALRRELVDVDLFET